MGATFDFSKQTVLVTGASRGIGYGIAEGFAAAGAELIVLAEDDAIHAAADRLAHGASGSVRGIVCDISDRAAVADALSGIGRLDVLVNNAGLERATPLGDADPAIDETFARVLAINVAGTNNVTREMAGRIADGGRIVVTSSIWGKTAVPDFSAYIASKHALIGLTRTWAKELGPRGITVNAVCPGWVRTEASMRSLDVMAAATGADRQALLDEIVGGQAIGGLMEPADIAGLYLFLASDAAANITGQAINADRGEVMV
ncbi:SDR family NAD(P)-dependent oxidoreductase [Breoghania sp. L-A4]|uniref:SDR family NAD(P)-dependent oxidoreductase n=1 Tax=Breoghania sp. L-A4 TaxID=2304600 RepID=UPI000E35B81A|nr:SDR family NAD(P)-dependent oxidoreductase [Breoghania sp. L-A4]AXS41560.1 SDR family oxidoreductase [Breoghania sp. L-A4]